MNDVMDYIVTGITPAGVVSQMTVAAEFPLQAFLAVLETSTRDVDFDDSVTFHVALVVEATGDTIGFWRCDECDGLVRGDAQGPGHAEACSLHPDNEVGE